ncbi:MAG TPA: tRNA dihydrouridine(20/20a) synthase DusA [Cyanobacteria bacterium UBA11149]|nr:tRNA dihydrouridine(20/20a) synthase DusA [Cyanobacteria bacterium UBA11367]HBE58018.1 tRNA dihydrouridine(20/20a) synthase DusA [Cyanobacteria bacterium UBA11366]HBK66277.1 tRNA dihydrouridine(20/20a) synthase DusA [Cyanobacteria bacterium UBA11166]HBR72409.1 tRNA dihydrouridine(20/20a) synthase DusA [Cyanobacteria bacterium UBA11159]HBS71743.1 tRNA dihydrouridine(20/20a) synthase DusA [Cyanobacteria bacterium UBA11153]HBW90558.1 tRNA dihydrouridine(20/20a) synthase DusA [Cyanobacteria bac
MNPIQQTTNNQKLSIAPMMDRTDRHFRYFMRQITRRTLLYTEMVTSPAIIHGDRKRLLGYSPEEKPLVLQVGGDNPTELAECAKIAENMGYDEINLNVGCPSSRVQDGNFGACLMAQPEKVANCVKAMIDAVTIPVTVKHRIGIDDLDSYEYMANFVRIISEAGCHHFTVHARKAWLKGLSPKENRTVPPLRYHDIHRLKQEFPHLFIEINGGFINLSQVKEQLQFVDAVMIGRAAYDNPYLFATVDSEIYGEKDTPPTRHQVAEAMLPYIDFWVSKGLKLNKITRHILQLFSGQPGSRIWKQILTEKSCILGAGAEVVREALEKIHEAGNRKLSISYNCYIKKINN